MKSLAYLFEEPLPERGGDGHREKEKRELCDTVRVKIVQAQRESKQPTTDITDET